MSEKQPEYAKITWSPVRVKLSQIRPWSDNPRYSTKAQAERLIQSERELGQPQTLAISPFDENGIADLYDGHQRYMAWMTVKGHDFEVWALQASRYLTDEERRKAVILLHAGAVGSWNWDELSNWDTNLLKQVGMDEELLKNLQSDTRALAEMLESERFVSGNSDAEPEIDRAEELREKWGVQTGDLWQIGEHRLICGDCTDAAVVERLMGGERAQMCFTSPPYNVGVSAQLSGNTNIGDNFYKEEYNDNQSQVNYLLLLRKFTDLALLNCDYVFTNIQCLAGNKYAFLDYWHGYSDKFCDVAIWDKLHAAPQQARRVMDSRFEFVLVFGGNGSRAIGTRDFCGMVHNVYTGQPQRHNEYADIHAGTMPLDFPEHFIKTFTNFGETVYEPFAGTGTTMVACQNLGRKCRAVEISPAYCAVILERMTTAFPGIEIKRLTQSY